ncbi:heterokaryon incompatibility protein-domain-containing protein [Cladorrhinum samala]|uniref:Heterokaryon incompatibility protein-domain-containing protein n=1 Tax=Cladorrhinum samala TaxID=585594 RepID=A0AAV9HL21_9PEZI|nr:heterokaryon incompatibility protein-domain-containing protein [Cladorrhinum samala]
MRLLHTQTLTFRVFSKSPPRYAILSHTWEDDEVSLHDLIKNEPSLKARKGYRKIAQCCRAASQQGLEWAWIDTCCIDKTDNAELTESINSMFRWYQEADVCYVFLADLPEAADLKRHLARCRWFTRGWTLQELLAPRVLWFYDGGWTMRGTGRDLVDQISDITGIARDVLSGGTALEEISVSERMSWAANRTTTRPEDVAYCLLGIFGVNMPMIYGEGDNSFRRLQEQIIQRSNDLTVFAWSLEDSVTRSHHDVMVVVDGPGRGYPLLAQSPKEFERRRGSNTTLTNITAHNALKGSEFNPEFVTTNKGLRITSCLLRLNPEDGPHPEGKLLYFLGLGELKEDGRGDQEPRHMVGITLNKLGHDMFVRRDGHLRVLSAEDEADPRPTARGTFYVQLDAVPRRSAKSGWAYGRISIPARTVPVANHRGSGPRHATVKVKRAIPESHWDETSRHFFRSSKKLIVFAASVGAVFEDAEVTLLAFIHQAANKPAAYLLLPEQHPELYGWFLRRKTERHKHYWDDLPGFSSPEPFAPFSDHVELMVNGSLYSLSAKIGDPIQVPRAGSRYEVKFEVMLLGCGIEERSKL